MKQANTDTTYCTRKCENKCWRHESNYEFKEDSLYCFTNECINVNYRGMDKIAEEICREE